MLNEFAKKCQEISNSKGFATDWSNINTKLLLVHTEISEAAEEVRAGNRDLYYEDKPDGGKKPCGFMIEVADAVIRLAELSSSLHSTGQVDLSLQEAVDIKMAYNQGRPYLHGKQY